MMRLVSDDIDDKSPAMMPTTSAHADRATVSPVLLSLAAAALGMALRVNFGQYDPMAIRWLTLAVLAAAVGTLRADSKVIRKLDERLCPFLPLVPIGLACAVLADSPLTQKHPLAHFQVGVAVGSTAMLIAAASRRPLARWGVIAMIAAALGLGLWTLAVAKQPAADICTFSRESADALLHGHNPYTLTFEDPYRSQSTFYGDGLSKDGRLLFGYPYLPLPLYMSLPGQLAGDYRYSMMAAIVGSIALIALMRPGRLAPIGAGLLLFTPRGWFVLEAGWIEPLVLVLFAAVVFAACRYRQTRGGAMVLGILAGLFFASKQYLFVLIPALWLLPVMREPQHRRVFIVALIVAALAVTLPLAVLNPKAFAWSAGIVQFHQPFRPDALSFLVPLSERVEKLPPAVITLVVAPLIAFFCAKRLPSTPASFAAAVGFTLLIFFAINKQAFCNYYYLVVGALACAVSALEVRTAARPAELPDVEGTAPARLSIAPR